MKKVTKYRLISAGIGIMCGTLFACVTKPIDRSNENSIPVENPIETIEIETNENETVETVDSEVKESIEVDEPEIYISPIEIEENKFDDEVVTYQNVYFTSDADLYDTDNNFFSNIEIYNRATEIFHTNEWSLIYIGEDLLYTKTSSIKELGDSFVEIDIGDQNVKLFKNNELLVDTDTVTGNLRTKHGTHIGLFEIWSMEHDRYLIGPGYKSWVSYFMPFDGGIGLHDATWRDEFGGEIYKTNGSHGCVNLPLEEAKTIYENVNVGYKVLVHN